MQRQAYLCFIDLVVLFYPSLVQCSSSGDYKVLVWSNGPAIVGETTSFNAEAVLKPETRTRYDKNGNVTYEFSWKVPSQPWIKHQKTAKRSDSFRWRWTTEAGFKTVSVYVRILKNYNGRDSTHGRSFSSYYATNRTEVEVCGSEDILIATLDAYQNSTLETRQGNDEDKSFNVGAVTLKLTIHNFPHQDLSGILYDWNLGDGTQLLDSNLKQVTHNFTTVKSCKVVVNLHGQIQGKYYNGTASKTLTFTVNIHPYLVVKSFAGPKLPSDLKYALPMDSPVEFEVKFKDPFKLVASVSTDWKFGNDTNVTNWKNTTIHHTFHKEGKYSLWVTIRVNTKSLGKKSFSIVRNLYVKAPVSLEVRHKHLEHKDKTVRFNISCNGSLPVSFHWCISKQCYLPPGETCMPTMEHSNSCSLIVNHRFSDAGEYCVNVGVMNDVSGKNTSLIVQIPGDIPGPKHNSAKASITGTVVALCIVCTLLIGIIIVAAQRWISSKREKTEKADFEFRDDDALSVSSVELFSNKVCFRKFRVWGSRRTAEEVPLCRDTRMYTL